SLTYGTVGYFGVVLCLPAQPLSPWVHRAVSGWVVRFGLELLAPKVPGTAVTSCAPCCRAPGPKVRVVKFGVLLLTIGIDLCGLCELRIRSNTMVQRGECCGP